MGTMMDKAAEMYGVAKGIFNNTEPPNPEKEEINSPDEEKLYQMAKYDYQVFKEKRQGKEDVWRKEQQMWVGDHWKGLRPPTQARTLNVWNMRVTTHGARSNPL